MLFLMGMLAAVSAHEVCPVVRPYFHNRMTHASLIQSKVPTVISVVTPIEDDPLPTTLAGVAFSPSLVVADEHSAPGLQTLMGHASSRFETLVLNTFYVSTAPPPASADKPERSFPASFYFAGILLGLLVLCMWTTSLLHQWFSHAPRAESQFAPFVIRGGFPPPPGEERIVRSSPASDRMQGMPGGQSMKEAS